MPVPNKFTATRKDSCFSQHVQYVTQKIQQLHHSAFSAKEHRELDALRGAINTMRFRKEPEISNEEAAKALALWERGNTIWGLWKDSKGLFVTDLKNKDDFWDHRPDSLRKNWAYSAGDRFKVFFKPKNVYIGLNGCIMRGDSKLEVSGSRMKAKIPMPVQRQLKHQGVEL